MKCPECNIYMNKNAPSCTCGWINQNKSSASDRKCNWNGCKLRWTIKLTGQPGYCSFHDDVISGHFLNNREDFDKWLKVQIDLELHDPLADQKVAINKHFGIPIERFCSHCDQKRKILRTFTWENITGG